MAMMMLAIMAMSLMPSAILGQSLCTICPDGTKSFKAGKYVPSFNSTCGQLETLLLFQIDEEFCNLTRSQLAAWCECPGVEPTCTFCPDGTEPANPDFVIPDTNGTTCSDYVYYASIASSDTCNAFTAFRDLCGGCVDPAPTTSPAPTASPPTNECSTLCPDGTNAPDPDAIIYMQDGETFTCGQVEEFLALGFGDLLGNCEDAWLVGVTLCGCAGNLANATCLLCEDGSVLPDPSFEFIQNFTCGGFHYAVSSGDEIECATAQATVGVYCGCNNPDASEDACRICGGSLLPDASLIADPDNQTSCLELEYLANTGEVTCKEVQDTWAPFCCSTEIPLVELPRAPTAKPSTPTAPATPTVAPSKTSDAALVSNNLASLFFAGAAFLLVV